MSENLNNNNKPKINVPRPSLSWLYVIIALVFGFLYFSSEDGSASKEITYTEFKDMVSKGYANKSLLTMTILWICLSSLSTLSMCSEKMQAK